MVAFSNAVTHAVLKTVLSVAQRRKFRALLQAAETPRQAQAALLKQILAANADTEFGRRHDFSRLIDIGDYRRAVPVQTYEDLRPLIERQESTGAQCLTQAPPVYYHRTSGTVGAPKDIPITAPGLKRIKQHQKIFAYAVSRGTNALAGRLFGITGQAVEGTMPGGTPFGSASGLLYQSQSKLVHGRYVLPAHISDIEDYQTRYLAMAAHGLSESGVTCVGTANPSTLVRLLSLINDQPDAVLRAVADGHLRDTEIALKPNPKRSAQMAKKLEAAGRLTFTDIWPDLKAVLTWTGGSCGVPLRSLSQSLPGETKIIELGYVASEVQGTVNVDVANNTCLPMLLDTVFEFVERDAWENGSADFLALEDLDVGRDYYVFVTTAEGLYRYDMNDIVRVTGKIGATPSLTFVQKGKGVTSITGEKLTESQVLDAVMAAQAEHGIHSNFFILLANQDAAQYTLYVETAEALDRSEQCLSDTIERGLRSTNIEYDAKRASGRLAPLTVRWLQNGAGEAYRANRVEAGQRDAQFKYLHLQYAHECAFDFDAVSEAR